MATPRALIHKNWVKLIRNMTDIKGVLDHLYQDGVITEHIMYDITRETDPQDQVRRLLGVVKKRTGSGSNTAFQIFVNALRETGNEHLADLLREPSPTASEVQPAHTSVRLPALNQPTRLPTSSDKADARPADAAPTSASEAAACLVPAISTTQIPERRDRTESGGDSGSEVFPTDTDWSEDEQATQTGSDRSAEKTRDGRPSTSDQSTTERTATSQLPGLGQDAARSTAETPPSIVTSYSAWLLSSYFGVTPSAPAPPDPPLPSPLPQNVLYHAKHSIGPVYIPGQELVNAARLNWHLARLSTWIRPELPVDWVTLCHPKGLAYHAATRRLYVASSGNGQVVVCDSRGENRQVFYAVERPWSVAVSVDGERVYVVTWSLSLSLHILNSSGDLVKAITSIPGDRPVACLAVTCYQQQVAVLNGPRQVIVFSRDGEYVRQWRLADVKGSAMAVDDTGRLYITDVKAGAVIVYSWEGEELEKFGEYYGQNPYSPGICVDGDGRVCVSRSFAHRVDVYDRDRRPLTSVGGRQGRAPGELRSPHGLCLLPDGRLVVSDSGNDRLQIY